MKQLTRCIPVIIILLCAGCETITYDSLLLESVASMNGGALASDCKIVGTFKYHTRAMFTVYDLITLKNPEIAEEMKKAIYVNNGDAVVNIKIVEETDAVDILIGMFVNGITQVVFKSTVDIFSTRSVIITGDVVKYPDTSYNIPSPDEVLLAAGKEYQEKTRE